MNDERSTFIEEIKDRKHLVDSNRKKTGWGNRRGHLFEQPELSEKEIRKRHGKVMEYKIDRPISWSEFLGYPVEMQQKWVDAFIDRFGCGSGGMALVFDKKAATISQHMSKYGIKSTRAACTDFRATQIREWLAYCNTPKVEEAPAVEAPKLEPKKSVVEIPFIPVKPIESGSFSLCGTAAEISQMLFGIFRDTKLSVKLDFEVVHEEAPVEEKVVEDHRHEINACSFAVLKEFLYSDNVCATIVNRRPYKSMADLSEVPGVNDKLFAILSKNFKV